MLFILPSMYEAISSKWVDIVGPNHDMLLSILMMWLNTELTWTAVTFFFIFIEKFGILKRFRIHEKGSNWDMVIDTIKFKPIGYLVDVPIYCLSYVLMNINSESRATDPLPDLLTIARDVLSLTLIFDFLFYCWHRSLHTRSLYKFHKKHHEVKICFACANEHESLLELTGNILWKMIPPAFLHCHVYTVCIFRSVVKFFALYHHSGYELPVFKFLQSIPFIASPSYHDHHHFHGAGNFGGVFTIWDQMFGTDAKQRK